MNYLTADEVAAITKFKPSKIRESARLNEFDRTLRKPRPRGLLGKKVDGQWRFTEANVKHWMEGK